MIPRRAVRAVSQSSRFLPTSIWQSSNALRTRYLGFQAKSTACPRYTLFATSRRFSTSPIVLAAAGEHVSDPADLTTAEYHHHSDTYIDSLVESLEELAEEDEKIDVEYHSGVLNLVFPPAGTYVINKQPPNRQIWLSSPISGPKRYDYVVNKDGKGDWIYLRDGTTLTGLLNAELKLRFEPPEND